MAKDKMPGYLAIVLDERTSALLRPCATHETVKAGHITMAYRPSRATYEQYQALLGQHVEFRITKLVSDECAQAVCVDGVLSENLYPHVTLSLGRLPNGVPTPARYAKEVLFTNPDRWESELNPPFVGTGRVEFVRF